MNKWRTIQEITEATMMVAIVVTVAIYLLIQAASLPEIPPSTAQYAANLRHEAQRRYVVSSKGEPESCNVCKK